MMPVRTQEEILRNTRTVAQGLDALRQEYEVIESTLLGSDSGLTPEQRQFCKFKASVFGKNLENIRLGVQEAQMMMALASYMQTFDTEKQKLEMQLRRLCRENARLRDELSSTQKQVQASAQQLVQLEEEQKHLEFMNAIKKYDEGELGTNVQTKSEHRLDTIARNTAQRELGLRGNDSFAQPTQADALATSASEAYDPYRLKTLYSLVTQYAAQRRYKVAVPLCEQALEELEANRGHDHPDVATMLSSLAFIYRGQRWYPVPYRWSTNPCRNRTRAALSRAM
ncbi:kinesin light chain protein 2 [Aphelenchoides avenae]|nr:kinesin light chain protein 2 [Aphelenchus avenae]